MGRDVRNITADQLKNAISQKGKEGEPIIANIERIREDGRRNSFHKILIDAMETINGEEYIVYRNPYTGKGESVSWKDFLENWTGFACIPLK